MKVVLKFAQSFSMDSDGFFFMWIMLLMAAIGTAIVVERMFYLTMRANINAPKFMDKIFSMVKANKMDAAISLITYRYKRQITLTRRTTMARKTTLALLVSALISFFGVNTAAVAETDGDTSCVAGCDHGFMQCEENAGDDVDKLLQCQDDHAVCMSQCDGEGDGDGVLDSDEGGVENEVGR